jgi:uncharacterized protein DUF481
MDYLKSCCTCFMVILLTAASLFAAGEPSPTAVDEIVPTTGHTVSGTFEIADDAGVTMILDSGAKVTLAWDKINQVVLRHKIKVTAKLTLTSNLKDLLFEQPTIQVGDKSLTFAGVGSNSGTMTLARLHSISIVPDDSAKPAGSPTRNTGQSNESSANKASKPVWIGSISPKASLTTGAQGQQTLGATINLRATVNADSTGWHHQFADLRMQANNALTTQVGTPSIRQDNYDGEFGYHVFLTRAVYADAVAFGYHNSALNLYLEQRYGGGLGGTVFNNRRHSLELSGNVVYIGEHFYGGVPSLGFAGASIKDEYSINLTEINGKPVTLSEEFAYVPAFAQSKAWQLHGRADLNIPVTKSFSSTFTFSDDYIENVPNVRKNWSTSSVGFTYTF